MMRADGRRGDIDARDSSLYRQSRARDYTPAPEIDSERGGSRRAHSTHAISRQRALLRYFSSDDDA